MPKTKRQADDADVKMPKTKRHAYDAAFKTKAIKIAEQDGNRAAARELGVDESMVRRWRLKKGDLAICKSTTKKIGCGRKARWPQLEDQLEDWVHIQRADGRAVSTLQIRLRGIQLAKEQSIEGFAGGHSWVLRFLKRKGLSIRARTTLCQKLPPDFEEKELVPSVESKWQIIS